METGAEKQPESRIELASQADMCRIRTHSHLHKEKTILPKTELLAESKCNQLQPEANADAKTQRPAKSVGRS